MISRARCHRLCSSGGAGSTSGFLSSWVLPELRGWRGAGRHPGQYDRRGYVLDDWIPLAGLLAVGATGFVVESLRIPADRPHFEVWSVAGWQFANGLEALGLSNAAADRLHLFGFWLHALLALAFIAYLPYSK